MLGRKVSIDGLLIPIDFPQGEDIRIFATSADVELDYARLLARCVAQFPKQRFGNVRILGSERVVNRLDQHVTPPRLLRIREFRGDRPTVSGWSQAAPIW